MATRGRTSATTRRGRAPTDGARTAWPGSRDDGQRLCFALALWNGRDPILKERLFGLTNKEGNHGEDVKEYYFYLDATPTSSYLRYLYKYPQAAYPYDDLVATNGARSRTEFEYELLDTGVFDDDRYFDVEVEYAKASPDDIAVRITVTNRGPEAASLHLLPTLWFRNTWSWGGDEPRPSLALASVGGVDAIAVAHPVLGTRWLRCEGAGELLFTENETNLERLAGLRNRTPFVKDAFHSYLVHGRRDAVNPARTGTKAAAHYELTVGPGRSKVVRLRLSEAGEAPAPLGADLDALVERRRREADAFYATVTPASLDADSALVMRQALAGMLWTKQVYHYDVHRWLGERGTDPFSTTGPDGRNRHWQHMVNADVISMPDKWEYPWFAAWDLAFHVLALTLVDEDFAKGQLELMLRESYLHPSGQLPAYEWNFGDVNPPVHAWATIYTYRLEEAARGKGDLDWLERVFHKLLLNFTWWVNRKDRDGQQPVRGRVPGPRQHRRLRPERAAAHRRLPRAGRRDGLDGAVLPEHARDRRRAGEAPADLRGHGDEVRRALPVDRDLDDAHRRRDRDVGRGGRVLLRRPAPTRRDQRAAQGALAGRACCRCARSPGSTATSCAATRSTASGCSSSWQNRPELRAFIHDPVLVGEGGRRLASILDETKLRRVLAKMLDEEEFLSPHGIRSVSRYHLDHPYVFKAGDEEYRVAYQPAESDSGMFGGNSNWRGPIWMPVNALIVRALVQYHAYYGDDVHRGVPDGVRPADDALPGGRGARPPPDLDLPARRDGPPARVRRDGQVPGGPALAGPDPVLRVLPRRQRGRSRRQPPDRLDRRGGPGAAPVRAHRSRGEAPAAEGEFDA